MTVRTYGWKPDLPDHRDHRFDHAAHPMFAALPPSVDLRPQCPTEVYDQGQLGSCTANSIAGAVEFDLLKQKATDHSTPSRLFIYYNERSMEGSVGQDSGAQIRDGIKSVASLGAPDETLWPYSDANPGRFTTRPPKSVYLAGLKRKVTSYQRVDQSLVAMKTCLASGYPFVFGFTVYESFESQAVASSGVVPMPGKDEQVLGGHAVLCIGYDDTSQRVIVRNSWGPDWAIKGYFTMPYNYITSSDLADDFWTVRAVAAG